MAVAVAPTENSPPLEEMKDLSFPATKTYPSTSTASTLLKTIFKSNIRTNKPIDLEIQQPQQAQRSFSQVVQGLNLPSSSKVPEIQTDLDSFLKPISIIQGKPTILFPMSKKKLLVDKLKFVLVGKFSHGKPPLRSIRNFFSAMKLQKPCTISLFDRKHIFIECYCKTDFYFIWLHLAWVIEGFIMRVLKWTDDFNPNKESAIVPVWVRFEGLPLYMFDEMSLLSIANSVGKPIKVDPRNVTRTIVNSARICVELDVANQFLDSFYVSFEEDDTKVVLDGFLVKIYYDEVPPYCEFCCHIGHGIGSCKRRDETPSAGEGQACTTVVAPVPRPARDNCGTDAETPAGEGHAWTDVAATADSMRGNQVEIVKGLRQRDGMPVSSLIHAANSRTISEGTPRHTDLQGQGDGECGQENVEYEELVYASTKEDSAADFSPLQGLHAAGQQHPVSVQTGEQVGTAAMVTQDTCCRNGAEEARRTDLVVEEHMRLKLKTSQIVEQIEVKCTTDSAGFALGPNITSVADESPVMGATRDPAAGSRKPAAGNPAAAQGSSAGSREPADGNLEDTPRPVAHQAAAEVFAAVDAVMSVAAGVDGGYVAREFAPGMSVAGAALELHAAKQANIEEIDTPVKMSIGAQKSVTQVGAASWADLAEEEKEREEQIRIDTMEKEEKEPQLKIVDHLSPSEVKEFAIQEIENICATPNKVKPVFEDSPILSNQYILDKDGSPVLCSDVIGKSRRIFLTRHLVDRLKQERGTYALKNKDTYDKLVRLFTKETSLAIEEHQQGISFEDAMNKEATSCTQNRNRTK